MNCLAHLNYLGEYWIEMSRTLSLFWHCTGWSFGVEPRYAQVGQSPLGFYPHSKYRVKTRAQSTHLCLLSGLRQLP